MFYVIGQDKESKQYVISSNQNLRLLAKGEILESAKMRGLAVNTDEIRPVQGKRKQGNCITKNFKIRKKLRAAGKRTDIF